MSISQIIAKEEELSGCRESDALLSDSVLPPTTIPKPIASLSVKRDTISPPPRQLYGHLAASANRWRVEDDRYVNISDIQWSYRKAMQKRCSSQELLSLPYNHWTVGGTITPPPSTRIKDRLMGYRPSVEKFDPSSLHHDDRDGSCTPLTDEQLEIWF